MFQISGVSNDSDNINGNLGLCNDFYYVYFKTDIPHTLPLQEAQNEFNKYFDTDLKNNLYFKVLINTTPDTSYKDYVYGYAEILDAALINDNNQNQYYGRIQLKGVPIGKVNSQEVHPFSKAAIHSGMINTPNLTFGHPDYNNLIDQPLDFANQFIQDVFLNTSFLNNLIATFQGPQKNLYNNNVGKHIDTQKSIIRLLSRTDKKGGGSRVKKIIYNNSWADMTNQAESTSYLVKEYQYIKEDGTSSGVASYEPQLGGDEIPQHLPYTYNITHHTHVLNSWAKNLVSSPEYLSFYPIAESAFPSPAIYYERVVETNKAQNNLSNGYIVYHFFTTKDYPTIVNVSALQQKNPSFNLSLPFFHINKKHIAVSQGFTVINNDMNGKQKMVEYFDGNNILLKKITNSYNNNINGYTNFYCSSNNKNTKYSGLEKDVVVDLREESSVTSGGNVNANFNAFFVPFFPPISIFFSMFLFVPNYTESVFRSATVSQVYYKKAVLSKQLISDRGAVLDVFNLYRNPVTADPLITATKNQWDEKTYQYSLPAYYVYKQMGTSSPYTGHSFNMKTNAQGKIIQTNYIYLHDGDVVILPDTPACRFAWIYNTQLGKYLLDKDGNPITSSTFIGAYLWQSGYKNMLKPVVQTIQSKELPTFTGNLFQSYLATHDILNAQATKYIDYYSYRCTNCGCENNFVLDSTILNIGNGTPAVIRYYIESACNCDGSIILLPAYDQAGNPIHFFYNQQEITHIDSLCANTTITIYINNNSNQSFTITIPNGTQTITSYQTINPFIYKLKNAWRSYKDYVFISPREPQHTNTPIDLKNQGQYTNFVPFWYWDTNTWEKNESAWLFKECYNFADIHGNAIESYDMSNVYQAAGIAFKGKLQEFIAYNAHNSNIAFDGFEDYHPYYLNNATPQQPWQHKIDVLHTEHFRLSQHKPSWVSLEKPHTGYYSLQIPAHDSILKTTRVNDNILLNSPDTIYSIPFKITSEYCSDVFHLNNNTKYLYSFWYYGDSINYSSLASVSFLNGNNIPDTIDYISPAIEGWRQVTGHFTYQVTLAAIQCTKIIFSIINHTDSSIFIDDFRMHPYQANMKSFVYNPFNLLPVALLDENNFATIYQYDEQQQVQNIIKETEKGLIFIDYKKKHKMIK